MVPGLTPREMFPQRYPKGPVAAGRTRAEVCAEFEAARHCGELSAGGDTEVLALNRAALDRLAGIEQLEVVPGATHLFEQPGALERVVQLAAAWFARYLAPQAVQGATVIVVDDGIATGTTMRAALKALRRRGPAWLVLAVPVAPSDTVARSRGEVDDLVCPAALATANAGPAPDSNAS